MKKNFINEILDYKKRLDHDIGYDVRYKLSALDNIIKSAKKKNGSDGKNTELLRYIPIVTVACLQTFFKGMIKELIDFGKPFSKNITKLIDAKKPKIDFEVLTSIQSEKLTVGEIFSHQLSINNLEDINYYFSTIVNSDFLLELKKFNQWPKYLIPKDVIKIFKTNSANIYNDVKKIFEMRHIFCHETAENVVVRNSTIIRCFESTMIFIDLAENYLWHVLYPEQAYTQFEMTENNYKILTKLQEELKKLIENIKIKLDPKILKLFNEENKKWKEFVDFSAKVRLSIYEGGTIYGLMHTSYLIEKTKERMSNLRNEYKDDLEINEKYIIE